MGGSAKANANFGPGLYEMETILFSQVTSILACIPSLSFFVFLSLGHETMHDNC